MQRGIIFTLVDLLQFDYVTEPEQCLLSKTNMFTLNQIRMLVCEISVAKNPLYSLSLSLNLRQITEPLACCPCES